MNVYISRLRNLALCASTVASSTSFTLLALTPAVGQAQAFDAVRLQPTDAGDDRRVGLGMVRSREFSGASRTDTVAFPLLDFEWRNGWFAGTTNGIGLNLSKSKNVDWGFRLTGDFGREEKDSPELRGLGDIDPALEVGAFANWTLNDHFRLTSSVRRGAGNDGDGLVADVGLEWSLRLRPGLRVGGRLAATAINGALMRERYGISAAQSSSSGLAAYAPTGGLQEVRASLSASQEVWAGVQLTAAFTYTSLRGDADKSPLVRDPDSPGAFVGISYSF